MVGQIVSEAKKKKGKKTGEPKKGVSPKGFSHAEALDFSAPLGPANPYYKQGGSSWGPLTGPGTPVEDNELSPVPTRADEAVRSLVRQVIRESESPRRGPQNIWEKAMHWYDNQRLGLGNQTSEGIQAKKAENAKKSAKRSR